MKNFLFILICIPALCIAQTETIQKKVSQKKSGDFVLADNMLPDSIAPDHTEMSYLNSVEFSEDMIPGWNVGNSLDAVGGETSWGNPLVTQQLMDSVKAAGFNSVRIPVAWSKFSDTSTYAIDIAWMDRVEEVVNYILNADMYAIINIHWDGGWIQPTYAMQGYVSNRLAVMWNQIAIRFRDYNDHLLFAGMNEIMFEGDYGPPVVEYYTVQNSYNQTFVTTVRSTGGRNAYRYLVVQGFNTNIDHTVNYFTAPTDATDNRLMVEVHYYDPYDFSINTGSTITQWGKNATDPSKTETWANESYANGQFNKMMTHFVDNGYAVILGEYGAIARLNPGSDELNAEHAEYRRYYIEYITQSIINHGLVPYYWDNGSTGNNSMGLFNRSTGGQVYPEIIRSIIESVDVISDDKNSTASPELLKFYPNPVPDVFYLEIRDEAVNYCQLYNSNGQMIKTLNVQQGIKSYNISDLKTGLYFIKLSTRDGVNIQKLIKN